MNSILPGFFGEMADSAELELARRGELSRFLAGRVGDDVDDRRVDGMGFGVVAKPKANLPGGVAQRHARSGESVDVPLEFVMDVELLDLAVEVGAVAVLAEVVDQGRE